MKTRNRLMLVFFWIACLVIAFSLLFPPTRPVHAQEEPQTITATGTITHDPLWVAVRDDIPLTMTFPPAGGPVTGSATAVVYLFGPSDSECYARETLTFSGTFAGGDGGYASGTYVLQQENETCIGVVFTDPAKPWEGNFYANGTGSGHIVAKKSEPGWQVTYSPAEFQAALGQSGTPAVHDTPTPASTEEVTYSPPPVATEQVVIAPTPGSTEEVAAAPASGSAGDCSSDLLNAAACMGTPFIKQGLAMVVSVGATLATILAVSLGGVAETAQAAAAPAASGLASAWSPTGPDPMTSLQEGTGLANPALANPGLAPPGLNPELLEKLQGPAEEGLKNMAGSPVWGLGKNVVGPASTVVNSLSEFFDFKESAGTLQKLHNSLAAYGKNPTAAAAEEYLNDLRGTTNVSLKNTGKALGFVSNAMDVGEAIGNGLNRAAQRGFTGTDKFLAVSAELAKKTLVYALTKNPVVGLADSAIGGATEMVFGKGNRVDIGTIVDKGSQKWDQATQEYASYSGGSLVPDGSGGLVAADAKLNTQDAFLSNVRRIKSQVANGKLDTAEAGARIRKLRDTMDPGFSE